MMGDCEHIFYDENCHKCGRNAEAIIDDLEQQLIDHERWLTERDLVIERLERDLRWIPVSERLPELAIDVYVWPVKSEKPLIGWLTDLSGTDEPILATWESRHFLPFHATHWKPITAPGEQ